MSKAFTKDDAEAEPLARAVPRLEPGQHRYVTADGFRRFQQELAALAALRAADLTEAQKQRAVWLAALLPLLTSVEPRLSDRVLFGARVTLEAEDGERTEYRIVGPDEVADRGDISVDAPLARALLGKSEGDTVTVRRPKGEVELTVVSLG